jgi:hypothetical protein
MFYCLIIIFPSDGGLDVIDITAIEISLSYQFAGQVVLPVLHPEGDVKAIAVCDPV